MYKISQKHINLTPISKNYKTSKYNLENFTKMTILRVPTRYTRGIIKIIKFKVNF